MPTTRREWLRGLARAAGTAVAGAAFAETLRAQSGSDPIIRQLGADLERHAAFGDKFSGGPGDTATADWIAGRLRQSGYRVQGDLHVRGPRSSSSEPHA